MRGSPQNTYLVIVEPREVPPTAEIARFGRYTACWRESELSQPRPFPVPPLPQFGSPVRGQSRALMRVLNCLDCTAGYPVHHEGAAHGVADCDSAAMLARSSLCQFTVVLTETRGRPPGPEGGKRVLEKTHGAGKIEGGR